MGGNGDGTHWFATGGARKPLTTGGARGQQSALGQAPAMTATRSSASSARGFSTSSISVRQRRAPTQAAGSHRGRGVTKAPQPTLFHKNLPLRM